MKRSRRYASKVKTGCSSCKTRKVKCDERKPSCLRCERFGVKCDGYLPLKVPPKVVQAQGPLNLLPKGQVLDKLLPQPSNSILFDNENDYQYFDLFCNQIVVGITPYFNPQLWRRLILQACATESTVRFVAIAIGALGKTYATARSGSKPEHLEWRPIPSRGSQEVKVPRTEKSAESILHHQNALKRYEKALRRAVEDLSSGQQNLRTTLISCIMIVCFEELHGNHESAKLHLITGLKVIQEWKWKQRNEYKHPLGFSSPAPDVVEDFLVQTFGRLEIQAISQADRRPLEYHEALKNQGKDAIEKMPLRLTNIEEARVYLDLIMRRSMHYRASGTFSGVSFVRPETGAAAVYGEDWLSSKPSHAPKDPPNDFAQALSVLGETTAWIIAFDPLLQYSIELGGINRISALALAIAAISSRIVTSSAFASTEMIYDNYLPDFRKVVSYSSMLLETSQALTLDFMPDAVFSFDLGVIVPLYVTIKKCRDYDTRHKAIDLLLKYPRREGLWNGLVTAAFGQWMTGIEEEGMVDGKIPEEARVTLPSIEFDVVTRVAKMKCLQRDKETGKMVWREELWTAPET